MTPQIIRRTILAELARDVKYAMPAVQLLEQVNLRLRPALTADELAKHLSWLLDREMVGFNADPIDPQDASLREWLIRSPGLTALQR